VRNDNPRLLVRSEDRRARRVNSGQTPSPVKVTVTERAKLDSTASFFADDLAEKLGYCPSDIVAKAEHRLGSVASVVDGGWHVDMRWLSEDLHARGVRRLMVEGGGAVLTQFLAEDLADELHLVVAPLLVGDVRATRFVEDGRFPWTQDRRATLAEARPIGDVVLLRYALSPRFSR
jgi:5-amino-6-(5-phosphoribosylamino)uracil reductase